MNGTQFLSVIPIVLLAGTVHLLPWLPPRTRLFGVTIPAELRAQAAATIIRKYQLEMLPWTLAAIATALFLHLAAHPLQLIGLILVFLLAATWEAWRINGRLRQSLASSESHLRQAQLTEHAGGQWWFAALLAPFAVLAAAAVYLHSHWSEIPGRFPIHWELNGLPNGWAERTAIGVYGPLMIGGIITILITTIAAMSRLGSRRSTWSPAAFVTLVIVAWTVGGASTIVSMLPVHQFLPREIVALAALTLALSIVSTVAEVRGANRASTSEAEVTPDSSWHGGIFYFNPSDPALLVEKRIGVGWTFNFARPLSWVLLTLLLLVPVGIVIATSRMVGK